MTVSTGVHPSPERHLAIPVNTPASRSQAYHGGPAEWSPDNSVRQIPATVTRLCRHRLHVAVHNGPVAPGQLFTSLFASSARSFWLDGANRANGQSRFAHLGDDTGPLAEFCSYDLNSGVVAVQRAHQQVHHVRQDIFTYLRQGLARRAFATPDLPFAFTCGYVGYFGDKLKAVLGGHSAHRSTTPDTGWLFADRVVVVDRLEQTTYALCLAEDSSSAEAEATGWLDATLEHLDFLSAHNVAAAG